MYIFYINIYYIIFFFNHCTLLATKAIVNRITIHNYSYCCFGKVFFIFKYSWNVFFFWSRLIVASLKRDLLYVQNFTNHIFFWRFNVATKNKQTSIHCPLTKTKIYYIKC